MSGDKLLLKNFYEKTFTKNSIAKVFYIYSPKKKIWITNHKHAAEAD